MTTPDPDRGSEYGGVPGLIQPSPHDPADSPSETRFLMMRTNPAGDTSGSRTFVPDEKDAVVPSTIQIRR
mgnify:CR=1 FL=1